MYKQSKTYLMAMVLPIFLIQAGPNILGPHVATIAANFPDVAYSTVLLLQTIPTLLGILGGVIVSPIQKALRLKGGTILGCLAVVIGGMMPLLNTASFPLLLVSRVVYGFGFGFLYAFCQNLVAGLFTFEDQPRMMGLGTTFQTIGVILFSMGGVALSNITFNCVWLIHLVFVLPLVLAFFLKEPEVSASAETVKAVEKSNEKIPGSAWFVIFCFGIMGLAMMNMFLFISDIVVANGFGGPVEAGLVTTIFGVAGVVGSAVYTSIANKVAKFALPLGALMFAVGFLIMGFAQSILYMYVGAAIAEFGFVWIFPSGFNLIARITPPSKVPSANGMVSTAFNGFAFFCSYVMLFLLKIFGKSDDLRFAFTIGGVMMLAVAVAMFFFKSKAYVAPSAQEAK